MIQKEEDIRTKAAIEIAEKMAVAARTAPKSRGRDTLSIVIISGDDIERVAVRMVEIGTREDIDFFKRDAECVRKSKAILLIGSTVMPQMLNCKMCGFATCKEKLIKASKAPCTFNSIDLGIALGSAVSVAADNRVDNRILYTAGVAAAELGILGDEVKMQFGIPISISEKSPFFDRKS